MQGELRNTAQQAWQLRPMGVGEVLDTAIRLYRHHFLLLVGIMLVMRLPLNSLDAISGFSFDFFYGPPYLENLWLGLLGALVYLGLHGVLSAALVTAISGTYRGQAVSIGSAYRVALRHTPALFVIFVTTTILSVVALGVGGLLAFLSSWLVLGSILPSVNLPGPARPFLDIPLRVFLVALVFLPYLWINSRLTFALQAVVLEGWSPRAALCRSWELVKEHGAHTLVAYVVLALFSFLAIIVLGYTGLFFVDAIPSMKFQEIAYALVPAVLSLLVMPIRVSALTLLYYDLRVRKEGLDLELQAAALADDPSERLALEP